MKNDDQLNAPLNPVEALMSIRVILDATVDRSGSIPMEAALRLIDAVLINALPSLGTSKAPPKGGVSFSK